MKKNEEHGKNSTAKDAAGRLTALAEHAAMHAALTPTATRALRLRRLSQQARSMAIRSLTATMSNQAIDDMQSQINAEIEGK